MTSPWPYLISSALLYAISFLFPVYCWWCVFLFLVPLFYYMFTNPCSLTFLHGFVWGLLYWSLLLFGLWQFLFSQASSFFMALGASLFFVSYLSLWSGVWVWLSARSMLITTWLYFEFIWRGVLIIFGTWQGMPISYPLLPLAQCPQLLQLVPMLGTSFLNFLLILFSYCCAVMLTKRHAFIASGVAALSLLPFIIGWAVFKREQPPAWLERVVCVTAHKGNGKWLTSRAIMEKLQQAHAKHPDADIFVLPESALPHPLFDDDYCLSMWYDNAVQVEATIVLGAYHKVDEKLFNSFYVLQGCRITHCYDKTSLLPFAEKLVDFWCPLLSLHNLFASDWVELSAGMRPRAPLQLANGLHFVPYICSELFFSTTKSKENVSSHSCPLICLVNDSWFPAYMQKLLFLNARLTALMWQQEILYCSYAYQCHIGKLGAINTCPRPTNRPNP